MVAVRLAPRQDATAGDWSITAPTLAPVGVPGRPVARYRRRRAALLCGLLLGSAAVWLALPAALGGGGSPLAAARSGPGSASPVRIGVADASARVWVVRPGDTLWTIALSSGVRGDIRPYVDRLFAETGGAPLQIGERVPLPAGP